MSKLDDLSLEFLKDRNVNNAINLLVYLRQSENFKLGLIIGEFLSKEYVNNYFILQEYALSAYSNKKFDKSYDIVIIYKLQRFYLLITDLTNKVIMIFSI